MSRQIYTVSGKNGTNNVLGITLIKFNNFSKRMNDWVLNKAEVLTDLLESVKTRKITYLDMLCEVIQIA